MICTPTVRHFWRCISNIVREGFWLGNRDFPHTAVCYRLAYAHYPRALHPFAERQRFADLQAALVRTPPQLIAKNKETVKIQVFTVSFCQETTKKMLKLFV